MNLKYDQHFMNDNEILSKVASAAEIDSDDVIFEVGPGLGSLSRKILSRNPKKLVSAEVDKSLDPEIDDEKFELIFGNALEIIDETTFDKIVANIPYAITEPLYKKILDLRPKVVVLLHGMDFYKNLNERETMMRYVVNAFYDVKLIGEVEGDKFEPRTKVSSAIVKLVLKEDVDNRDLFFQKLWERKDRLTKNALIFSCVEAYGKSKSEVKEYYDEALGDKIPDKKLKDLSNDEFLSVI